MLGGECVEKISLNDGSWWLRVLDPCNVELILDQTGIAEFATDSPPKSAGDVGEEQHVVEGGLCWDQCTMSQLGCSLWRQRPGRRSIISLATFIGAFDRETRSCTSDLPRGV